METHTVDARVSQYFRRRQLGLRMLAYGARSQTVQSWTGLTRDQLVTLRRRWVNETQDRRRGPSPSSFDVFFKSSRARQRAALLAGLIRIVGAMPGTLGPRAARELPSLEAGERLCDAYEVLRSWDPVSDIDFEQAVLLAVGITAQTAVRLDNCRHCQAAMLIDKLGSDSPSCSLCRSAAPRK